MQYIQITHYNICGASKKARITPTATNNLFRMSCIDGRSNDEMIGCPGGDAGLVFRVLLAAKFLNLECDFSIEKMKEIIIKSQEKLGHQLYYHTDDYSIVHFDPKKATNYDDAALVDNIGCGYFKLCASSPEKLDEEELCGNISKIFLRCLAENIHDNANKFDVICLHGEHIENHVVKSKGTKPIRADGHTFVYHPKVEAVEGEKIINVIVGYEPLMKDKKEELKKKYHKICKRHWTKAIGILAPGVEIGKAQ